jgi:hypothetical protein
MDNVIAAKIPYYYTVTELYTITLHSLPSICVGGPIQRRSTIFTGFVATKPIRLVHPRFHRDLISDRGKGRKKGKQREQNEP